MQTNDTNTRPSVRSNSDNLTRITAKHRAAYGRLQDLLMQMEELKSVAWMLNETSTRLYDWTKVVSAASLLHREICEVSSSLDRIHDDLGGLFSSYALPVKVEGGAV